MKYWLFSLPIALVPHLFFLLNSYRLCKKREIPPGKWLLWILLFPPLGLAWLYSSIQPDDRKKPVFIRIFIIALVVTLIFYYVAYILETA